MITDRYILVDKTPVPEPDLDAWGAWFESPSTNRVVEQTELFGGLVMVSTVFLGLNHSFGNGCHSCLKRWYFPTPRSGFALLVRASSLTPAPLTVETAAASSGLVQARPDRLAS